MVWVKIDDKAFLHPKVATLSAGAVRLWLFSLCWATHSELDGFIPSKIPKTLGGSKSHVEELVANRLWIVAQDGWSIHDYLEYQPSVEERKSLKEARSSAGKTGGRASGVTRGGQKNEAIASGFASGLLQNNEAKPKQVLSKDEAKDEAKTKPVPVPVPVPSASDEAEKRAGARPRNLDSALKVEIQERARLLERDQSLAQWLEPERWPEVVALAESAALAIGLPAPRLSGYSRDAGLRAIIAAFATFSPGELAQVIHAIPADPWFSSGKRGLSSLTPEVIRRLLDQRSVRGRQPDYAGERTFSATGVLDDDN